MSKQASESGAATVTILPGKAPERESRSKMPRYGPNRLREGDMEPPHSRKGGRESNAGEAYPAASRRVNGNDRASAVGAHGHGDRATLSSPWPASGSSQDTFGLPPWSPLSVVRRRSNARGLAGSVAALRDPLRRSAVCEKTLPLGRSGPVEVLWPESEGGRDGAPDAAEDGGPTRHGELIPAQRAIHGNVPSEPIQYAA